MEIRYYPTNHQRLLENIISIYDRPSLRNISKNMLENPNIQACRLLIQELDKLYENAKIKLARYEPFQRFEERNRRKVSCSDKYLNWILSDKIYIYPGENRIDLREFYRIIIPEVIEYFNDPNTLSPNLKVIIRRGKNNVAVYTFNIFELALGVLESMFNYILLKEEGKYNLISKTRGIPENETEVDLYTLMFRGIGYTMKHGYVRKVAIKNIWNEPPEFFSNSPKTTSKDSLRKHKDKYPYVIDEHVFALLNLLGTDLEPLEFLPNIYLDFTVASFLDRLLEAYQIYRRGFIKRNSLQYAFIVLKRIKEEEGEFRIFKKNTVKLGKYDVELYIEDLEFVKRRIEETRKIKVSPIILK